MVEREDEGAGLEQASHEAARAIWQTVLLARNESEARDLIGKPARKRLVTRILELMRVGRRALTGVRDGGRR